MKNLFKSRSLINLLLLSVVMAFFSCKKDDEEKPGTQVLVTPEKRVEILKGVDDLINSVNWEDKSKAYQQIQDHLKSFEEIAEVGYSEQGDNVWARFTDSVEYIIANNNPIGEPVEDIDLGSEVEKRTNTGSSNASARVGLPENNKVYLLNSLGTSFPSAQKGRNVIRELYKDKGYNVELQDGTIENLKAIKDVGTFYFSSHGGFVKRKDKEIYAVYTSDEATPENEKKYSKELRKGNLVIYSAAHNLDENGKTKSETHFAFTSRFVEEYMSFTNNAFMYLDMCHSFTETDFQFAFLKKSNFTGTFFGWTDNVVTADAYATSIYVFDRLLGANYPYGVAQPESPNQRSFDVPSVFADILKKDLGKSRADDKDLTKFAFLTYREGEGSTTLLRPSIAFLQVNEPTDYLYITGIFGDDLGAGKREVTIDGVPVEEVISWMPNNILCKIKSSGKGSAGDVIVKVGDHASHPRTLSEWRIPFKYKRPSEGTMVEEMTFHIHIRADLLKYRENAGEKPVDIPNNGFQVLIAKDSKVTYTMGGTANHTFTVGCTHTTKSTWADIKGEVAFFDPVNGNPLGEMLMAQAELKEKTLLIKALSPTIFKKAHSSFHHRSVCDGVPTERSANQETAFASLPAKFQNITLSFDQNFVIKGDQLEEDAPSRSGLVHGGEIIDDLEPVYKMTMEWGSIPLNFPPKRNAALRVSN